MLKRKKKNKKTTKKTKTKKKNKKKVGATDDGPKGSVKALSALLSRGARVGGFL